MSESPSESLGAWLRLLIFAVLVVVLGAVAGRFAYKYSAGTDAATVAADSQTLAQVQEQLTSLDKRLDDLESRRKAESARFAADNRTPASPVANRGVVQSAPKPQYQVSPASALPSRPSAAQPSNQDPASAQKLASLQQGLGALQAETQSNREAWQATTNRLADVAGELGAQHGQILQNQDELHQYLGRAQHTAITFELRRSSTAESVGPVRLSLKSANQKSKRYTLCVYLQTDCVEVRDRVLYEVVQLAVSHDEAPIELIATEVGKDGIVGYVEVPAENAGR
jgi:hypothetical protein